MTTELKVMLGVGLVTLLIIIGGVFLVTKQNQAAANPKPVDMSLLVKSDSHQTATESGKLTFVEFGDYQCPACGASYPLVKQAIGDFPGKINFVFRNFPLPQHQNAMIAAEAAEAAGAQGKYWEMHDALYDHQVDWSESKTPLDLFSEYAKDLGLDVIKFQAEVKANKYDAAIQTDLQDGNVIGINVTPTFFINGTKLEGLSSYADLKSRLNSALGQ